MPNLTRIDLQRGGNEASDLLRVTNEALLKAHGWDRGFFTVLDEGAVEDSIAVLGHRADAAEEEGWEIHELPCSAGEQEDRTEDAEALARHDGWVYAFGSHYGSKAGPLQAKRAWIARFREDAIDAEVPDAQVALQVVRNQFRLHRLVNEALDQADIVPISPGAAVRDGLIGQTIARGRKKEKSWAGRVREDDIPINIEGAAFRPSGTLLVALRFPTTADGEPLLVELAGVPAMFEDADVWPEVERVWVLDGVTEPDALKGFRALTHTGKDTYDVILGSIDATGKDSVLLEDHPEGGGISSAHWRFKLPARGRTGGTRRVQAEHVRTLEGLQDVEGVCVVDGRAAYMVDEEDDVELHFAD